MLIWLTVAVLATWRISSLLVLEDGPLDVFARVRRAIGADGPGRIMPILGGLLSCLACTSVWVGLAVTATWWPDTWQGWVLIPLALSTGAIVVERVVRA